MVVDTAASVFSSGPLAIADARRKPGDGFFQFLVVVAVLLEVVVFVEPAPVDALILACLALGLLFGKLSFSALQPLPLLFISGFALANLVSMYDPRDPQLAFRYLLITLYLIGSWVLFVGLFGRFGKPFLTTLLNVYCVAGFVSALLGIGGYFHLLPAQDLLLLNGRARGLFKDCNVYGPFLVPIALLAVARVTSTRWNWKAKAYPSVLLLTVSVAMLLSFSRACWSNYALALLLFFAGQFLFLDSPQQRRKRLPIIGSLLGAAVVGVVLFLSVPAVSSMFAVRVTSNGLQGYDRVRFATQSLALESAEKRPLGLGPGQAEVVFDYATHSMYLRIMSENGVAALLFLLLFVGATLFRAGVVVRHGADSAMRELNLIAIACIIGHLMNSIVIDTVHWRHIWFIYALPWAPVALCAREVLPVWAPTRRTWSSAPSRGEC